MARRTIRSKNARRFAFSNILNREVLTERLEERIVPAYVSGDFGWAASIDSTNIQVQGAELSPRSSVIDSQGNVYQVGSFSGTVDFDPGTGVFNLVATGGQDVFIEKLDTNGNFVWAKSLGGTLSEQAISIAVDASDNPVLTGWYQGTVDFDPNLSTYNMTSQGAEDTFIVKLNSAGSLLWAKSIGGNSSDKGLCISVDSSGSIIVGGWFYGTVDFDPNASVNSLTTNGGSADIFVAKYDSNGNYNWVKSIVGLNASYKQINDLQLDSNNNIVICGHFNGSIDIDPGATVVTLSNASPNSNGFLLKLDSAGNYLWSQQIAANSASYAYSVAIDSSNNVYMGGAFRGTADFDRTSMVYNLTSGTEWDAYLEKMGPDGSFLWARNWGAAGIDDLKKITIDTKSNVKIIGTFTGTIDIDPGQNTFIVTSNGAWDMYAALYTTGGDLFAAKQFGGNASEDVRTFALSPTGRPVITGVFSSTIDFDVDQPVKSISPTGGSNLYVTQWNRQFTKTTVAVSDSLFGANTTLTATIQNENSTSSTGTVTFTDTFNGTTTTLGTATVSNGVATLTLASMVPGVHIITAAYSGDLTNFSSTSYPTTVQLDAVSGSFGWAEAFVNRTGNEEAYPSSKVATDSQGNIYYAGSFTGTIDFDPGTLNYSNISISSRDTVLLKLSPSGRLLWCLQWMNNLNLNKLMIDSVGRVNLTGSFTGTFDSDPTPLARPLTSNGGTDAVIIRIGADGGFIDSLALGGAGDDGINAVAYDASQNMYLTGFFSASLDFDPSNNSFLKNAAGGKDGFLLKLTESRTFQWVNCFSSTSDEVINDLGVDNEGNCFIYGYTYGVVDLDPSAAIVNSVGASILGKYDGSGQFLIQGPGSSSRAYFIPGSLVIRNNNICVSGAIWNNNSTWHTFVTSFTSGLSTNWSKQFDGSYSSEAGIDVDMDGNIYITGGFTNSIDVDPSSSVFNLNSNGGYDSFVVKWDRNGAFVSGYSVGSVGDDFGSSNGNSISSICVNLTGAVIATGTFTGTVDFDLSAKVQNLSAYPSDLTKRSRYILNLANYAVVGTATSLTTYPTSSSVFGQSVTLNTALNSLNGALPSGLTASFYDGATLLGKGTVTNGVASFTTSTLSVGAHSLTAKIVDATNAYLTSTSTAVAFTVNKPNTSTSVSASANPSTYGQSVTFTAAVNAIAPGAGTPTGTVTFKDGSTTLGTVTLNASGVATLATSSLTAGTHAITVLYAGDTNFAASTSTALNQLVQSATSTTLASNANPSTFGQSVTFTATVTATAPGAVTPTGTVTFKDGTTTLGTGTLNAAGVATYSISSLGIGSHSITAVYAGDSNDLASTSTVLSQSVVAGSASSLTLLAGNSQSTTVAADFATLLQVQATDANGNPVANTPVTFTVVANGAGGSFASSSTVVTNASGIATAPKLTANAVAGSFTVTASASGVANVVFNLTNTAGAASAIVLTAGNNQSTVVNTAFVQSLQAKVVDTYGNAVAGVPVTFSVPSTGATGSFGASNVVTTNSAGLAVAPALTANTVAGSFQILATVTGLSAQNFNLTNSPGVASSLTIQDGNSQSATVGAAFSKALQVVAKDAYGNLVPGLSVTFTAPTTGASGSFATSATVTTNASGVATSPAFTANTVAGAYQVVASASGVTSQNFSLTNNAGVASSFAIVAGNNQTVTVGNAFATALQVRITDNYGNGVPGMNVQFTVPGTGAGASFAGSNVVATNSQGLAIAPTLTANTIAGSYSVIASATGLSNQTFNLTNSTSGATIAVAGGNNQSATVGSAFGTALQVKFSDSFGNPVSGVSVTFAAPASGASGTFSGNTTVTSNAAGIAAAPAFTANGKAGSFTVTASAANIGSVNFTLTNTAGAAASIVATSGNNQSATVNTAFGSPLIARVLDSYGNPVSGTSVTFSEPGSGALAVFGGSTVVTSNADGMVASPTLSANTVSGSYTVTASAANVSSAQFTLTNAAGLPTSIVKTGGNNQAVAANTAFATPLSVKVSDIYGNPVPNVNVAFSGPATGSSLVFAGASTVSTNAQGVATTPAITANSVAGTYNVQAYVTGSVNETFVLTNLAGAASKLAMVSGNYQTATVNTTFAAPLQMQVTDAYGNAVSGATVNFSVPTSGSGVLVTGSSSATSNATGLMSWSSFVANKIAGSYVVTASIAGGGSLNFNLTNQAGAAAIATVTAGSNQSVVVNNGFNTALQVKVTDTFGNPVASVPVNFATPTSGASAIFTGSTSVNTNADGVAISPSFTANTIAGNYTATATVGSLGQSSFNLTNLAGTPAQLAKLAGNNQSAQVNTAFANPLQVKVTDAWGNAVANVPVSFTVPATGAGATLGSTSPVLTNAQGVANSPAITANTAAGSFSVNVTANGNLNDSFSLTNSPGVAAKLVIGSGDGQFTIVNTAYTKGLQVLVTDVYSNPVPNVAVTFNGPSTGAGIVLAGGNVVNTNASGNALLDGFTANKVAGTFAVTAGVPNIPTVSFNLNNNPGAVGSLIPVAGNGQSTVINGAFPASLQVKVVDVYGNILPNVPVTFNSPGSGASLTYATNNTIRSDSNGLVSSPALKANGVIGTYSAMASTPGATDLNFTMTNAAPTVQSLVIQQGAAGRSFIRYVDLVVNDLGTVGSIVNSVSGTTPRITLTNTGLTGTTKKAVVLKGLVTAIGNTIHIDFGTKGLGGNAASNAADGSYLISLDLDGNGTLETTQRFWRLLGEVNGDKVVDASDTALVNANLNKSGVNMPGDTNGDGKVNSIDVSYVKKAQKRKIKI